MKGLGAEAEELETHCHKFRTGSLERAIIEKWEGD